MSIVSVVSVGTRASRLAGLLADQQRLGAVAGVADAPVKVEPVADDQELGGIAHFLLAQPELEREKREAVGEREVRQKSVSDALRDALIRACPLRS